MTILQIILLVALVVLTVWQTFILYSAGQYIRAGYQNVKFGILPGILAIPVAVALLVVSR